MVGNNINLEEYKNTYNNSISDNSKFWLDKASDLDWFDKPTKSLEGDLSNPLAVKWFSDGFLNVCHNCIDRHAKNDPDRTALIWKKNDLLDTRRYSYLDLLNEVNYAAKVFKELDINEDDFVAIYMPQIPESVFTMLACARLGLPHCIIFGGFGADALKERIESVNAKVLVTVKKAYRGKKEIDYESIVSEAVKDNENINILYYDNTKSELSNKDKIFSKSSFSNDVVPCVKRNSEDTLFVLHTSGSTGKPKSIVHRSGGYLLYANQTFKNIFDYKKRDVFFCTADIGWITGHSYLVYGPLSAGATVCMFEGIPTFPDMGTFWKIIEEEKVNIFYTAPTALKLLKSDPDSLFKKYDLSSLKVLGSVGEILDTDTWNWYNEVVGNKNCPIVDTWWQTETGGIMISSIANKTPVHPGSCAYPFFGIKPKIVDLEDKKGKLVIEKPWPGMLKGILNDDKRFIDTYFPDGKNYFSGDYATYSNNIFTVLGRYDDTINISGHLVSTREVEDLIDNIESINEASVVGIKHKLKGETLCCFYVSNDDLDIEINKILRQKLGPVIKIDLFYRVKDLPKTRSGKTMRRILRSIANGDDLSKINLETLSNSTCVEEIKNIVENKKI